MLPSFSFLEDVCVVGCMCVFPLICYYLSLLTSKWHANHLELLRSFYWLIDWLIDCFCLLPTEPPPAITVQGNVSVSPGSRAVLTCHVVSTVNFNLTWLRGGHDARVDPRVHVLTNLSLQVSSVSPDQSGWYECIAMNEGGVTSERIYLTVEGKECVSVRDCIQYNII